MVCWDGRSEGKGRERRVARRSAWKRCSCATVHCMSVSRDEARLEVITYGPWVLFRSSVLATLLLSAECAGPAGCDAAPTVNAGQRAKRRAGQNFTRAVTGVPVSN